MNEQNLCCKSWWSFELNLYMLRRFISFQRGTVGPFRSIGFEVTSYQSWKFEEKIVQIDFSRDFISCQVRLLGNQVQLCQERVVVCLRAKNSMSLSWHETGKLRNQNGVLSFLKRKTWAIFSIINWKLIQKHTRQLWIVHD